MKILVVGDSYMPTAVFERAGAAGDGARDLVPANRGRQPVSAPNAVGVRNRRIRRYARRRRRAPERPRSARRPCAPVTDAVLDASPKLAPVGCARGGPVNVDLAAASRRGIPVVATPGKNAEAVADLTLALLLNLARDIPRAPTLRCGGRRPGRFHVRGVQVLRSRSRRPDAGAGWIRAGGDAGHPPGARLRHDGPRLRTLG